MMFDNTFKEKLAHKIYDEMNSVGQGFDTGANNIFYFLRSTPYKLDMVNAPFSSPKYAIPESKEEEDSIRKVLKEYYDSGSGLEKCVNDIEKVFDVRSISFDSGNLIPDSGDFYNIGVSINGNTYPLDGKLKCSGGGPVRNIITKFEQPETPEEKFSFWMKKCAEVEAQEINALCQDELDECRKKAAEYRQKAWNCLNE